MGLFQKLKGRRNSETEDDLADLSAMRAEVDAIPLGLDPNWDPYARDEDAQSEAGTIKGEDDDLHSLVAGRRDDAASVYSFTPTLVDRSGELPYQEPGLLSSANRPLPGEALFATVVVAFSSWTPNPTTYIRLGLPAEVRRQQTKNLKSRIFKSIVVQLPTRIIDQTGFHAQPRTLEDAKERQRAHAAGRNPRRMGTVWDFELLDLVGVREKELMGLVLASLFKADDITHSYFVFPPESIRGAPQTLTEKDGKAVVQVKWATLRLLSPMSPSQASDAARMDKGKRADFFNPNTETAEQYQARLFEPSRAADKLLDGVLEHIERRGGIWTHAGHFCGHSFKNDDPKVRPEFTVHGVFPKSWLQRLKRYKNNKNQPLPSDWTNDPKAKDAPFVTYSLAERTGAARTAPHSAAATAAESKTLGDTSTLRDGETANGDSGAGVAAGGSTEAQSSHSKQTWEIDFLEGWVVGVTYEPYRTARARYGDSSSGAAVQSFGSVF